MPKRTYTCSDCGHTDVYIKTSQNARHCKKCNSTNLWRDAEMMESGIHTANIEESVGSKHSR